MREYKVYVTVYTLVGQEKREIVVKARTAVSAERKAVRILGNREYHVHRAELLQGGAR